MMDPTKSNARREHSDSTVARESAGRLLLALAKPSPGSAGVSFYMSAMDIVMRPAVRVYLVVSFMAVTKEKRRRCRRRLSGNFVTSWQSAENVTRFVHSTSVMQ